MHFSHILGQIVLPRQSIHPRKVVNLLMRLQFAQSIDTDSSINPLEIPTLAVLLHNNVEVKIPTYLFNHLVLSVNEVDSNGSGFSLISFLLVLDGGQVDVCILVLLFLIVLRLLLHSFIFIMNKLHFDDKSVFRSIP